MARPRVIFAFAVSPNKIGGVEAFSERLARELSSKGWDLTLWFQDDPPALVREFLLAPGNVNLEIFRAQSNMGTGNIRKSMRMFLKQRPTVFCYSLAGVVRWWPLLARLCGARGSVYYDQTSRPKGSEGYRASEKVRMMMKPLSRSVCATHFVRQCSEQEGIIPAAKTTVIYSGTDTNRVHGNGDEFRRRYGIPADRTLVMQVSWLVPEKGIDVALRAAQIALASQPSLHFVFCGEGVQRGDYEALARQLGIGDNVTWTGQVEDLVGGGAFNAADILIQCSQWQEAFGFTVAEAMSASLPIIASRIGGLPELVADGENGFLFDPPSSEQLAAHILTLHNDPALRQRMGESSRRRAVGQFDLQVCVDRWVELLMSV